MKPLDRIAADHQTLHRLCDRIHDFCTQDEPPPREILSSVRWELARTLLRHMPIKERQLYARLRWHPDPAVAGQAQAYAASAETLFQIFISFLERWPPALVEADWANFRVAMRQSMLLIENRMDDEERDLLPFFEGAPDIPPQPLTTGRNWAAAGWRIRELLEIDSPQGRAATG